MSEGIGLSAGELQRRTLGGASWSTLSSVLALPLAIGVSVVLARTLGPYEFARFAYLSFTVPLLIQLADLGYAQATTRWASQAFASGEASRAGELAGKLLGWNTLRLPLVLAGILVLAQPSVAAGLAVVGFALVATAGSGLVASLTAENRIATAAKLSLVQALAAAAAGVAAAVAGASGSTVWAVSFASGAVAAPGWLLTANPQLRRAALTPRLPTHLPPGFWRFSLGALAVSACYVVVFSRSEVVILDLAGEYHALAVFALAYGLAQRLTTPVDSLLGPLIPALAALDAAHPERLRPGFDRALRLVTAAVAFLGASALVATAFAAPVLFGPEYRQIGLAFTALALVSLLQSAAQPYTALAYALGRPAIALRALSVALVVDVAFALALVPIFGLWGAIAGNAAGAMVAITLAARAAAGPGSVRRAGVPVLRLGLVALAASAAAYAAALVGTRVHPLVGAVAAFAAGTAVFFAGARLTGGLVAGGDARVVGEALPRPIARALAQLASPAH